MRLHELISEKDLIGAIESVEYIPQDRLLNEAIKSFQYTSEHFDKFLNLIGAIIPGGRGAAGAVLVAFDLALQRTERSMVNER